MTEFEGGWPIKHCDRCGLEWRVLHLCLANTTAAQLPTGKYADGAGCIAHGGPDCICEDQERGPRDLETWWREWSAKDAPEVTRKAREYGSNSLQEQGRLLAELRGWDDGDIKSVGELLELGCFDYAHGKMQRIKDAILRGELPSEDTWRDLAVYALMVLRIRDCGTWPGPLAPEQE